MSKIAFLGLGQTGDLDDSAVVATIVGEDAGA